MDWSDSWRGAFQLELRAEAIGLAERGWPVLPGTYPVGTQCDGQNSKSLSGSDDQQGPTPVCQDWVQRIGASAKDIAEVWSGRPYSLLVATGYVLDAIEVNTELGRLAASVLRDSGFPVPIAAMPNGRWFFLTQSESKLYTELAARQDVVLHGKGSWLTLPPSPLQHGVVHWRVHPQVCSWVLPTSDFVQDALMQAARTAELRAGEETTRPVYVAT
ncbi:DNA primase [Pseudonocardiaceae bacterium YIM PH 21723]|nr:DNA primase [Pseudonocardiaceae bacterium YIM PH 21723]